MSGPTVAIVGSRGFGDLGRVRDFVRRLAEKYPDAVVVSGGARGVDQAAEEAAREFGLSVLSYRVAKVGDVFVVEAWEDDVPIQGFYDPMESPSFGKVAFYRNGLIVQDADHVVAFWDNQSNGTRDSIRKARAAGAQVHIIAG